MNSAHADPVKQQVAAHWDRRAAHFDEDFGHSIGSPAERAAWHRILDLVIPSDAPLDAFDAGCGTGFLSLELAARRHRVTGVDFAPAMLAEARRKAAAQGLIAGINAASARDFLVDRADGDDDVAALPHPLPERLALAGQCRHELLVVGVHDHGVEGVVPHRPARKLIPVGRLEPDRQKLVLLAYYNGWSREQLAAKFETPVNTVKTWLRRSMMDIRECLGL